MQNVRPSVRSLVADVQRFLAENQPLQAAQACSLLCQHYADFPVSWELSCVVAQRLGHPDRALGFIEQAIRLEPAEPRWRIRQARVLLAMRRRNDALRVIAALESAPPEVQPSELRALGEMAALLTLMDEHERALVYYRRFQQHSPRNASNWFNIASTERFLGHADEAEAAFDAGLREAPENAEAWYLRAGLRRQTPERNHVAEIEARLAVTQAWEQRWQLFYALAKEQEDLGHDTAAFASLKQGADLRRAHMSYRVQDDVNVMAAIAQAYPAQIFAGAPVGCDNDAPIFVFGLPRTGTTLVERILGSHSQVFAAGELSHFAAQMSRAVQALAGQGATPSKLDAVALSPQLDFAALGQAYMDSTRGRVGSAPRFVDKMPLNFLYAGLIARALPHATMIELVRHPLDACYAMYKQMFTMAYPFSYDLSDLAAYFCAYRRLMAHWHSVLPGRILRLRYEDLVNDQAGQTERLLAHCGLAWDDACLAFDRNAQPSTTASAVQVRQKVYRSSLGTWRRFETQLQPLIEALRADPAGQAALDEYA